MGFYTRFQGSQVNLDANSPTYLLNTPLGFTPINITTIPQGYINTINVIPGVVGVSSMVHLTLPTLVVPKVSGATYVYTIYIPGI